MIPSRRMVARMTVDSGDLVGLPATEQRRLIATKQASANELLDAHLAQIAACNPSINAVIALDASVGRARARAVDDATVRGDDPGPLAGLVTAHKDLTETADFPTTYGSPLFAGFRPAADSLVVARMRAAGVVAVGKTNTPEFGAGSHTFNPVNGTTYNPWDRTRSAGGSSGGAAAALACRMIAIADGSDMGGSLRNPAAWNNVVGLRTTPRLVPRVGPGNAWLPLTMEGPMGRTVDDVLLLLRVLSAPDARDPMQRAIDLPAELRPPDRPLRVAWSDDLGVPVEASQLDVLAGVKRTIGDLGWDVDDAEPDLDLAGDCFRVLRAWASANSPMARAGRPEQLKLTIREEVQRGNELTPGEVAAAYEQLATLWRTATAFFAQGFDVLACPTTQVAPFPTEWEYPTRVAGREMSDYIDWMASCWRITVTGCPTLSLPAGFDVDGLPVGIQLVAAHGADVDLLRAAKAIETATGLTTRRPPLP
jgi:amidase